MSELINLYHRVASFQTGCSLSSKQKDEYFKLQHLYNEATDNKMIYSVCKRSTFLTRAKDFIDAKND